MKNKLFFDECHYYIGSDFNRLKKKIKKLLFWLKFFWILFVTTVLIVGINTNTLLSLLLNIELLVISLFYIFILTAVLFNLQWILGFSFIIIILGGLEVALSFILLNL